MTTLLNYLARDLIALLLGVLTTLAFAPFYVFPFAIFAPAGLLILFLHSKAKRAFWLGFTYGLGLFGSGIYWVYHSIHVFGGVPGIAAVFILFGLVAFLALYPAFTGYLLARYFPHQTKEKILFAFPALWVICEWLRCWIATGFPWLLLGYSQTSSPLKGFAPIFSVYGVSFAVAMTSALFVSSYFNWRNKMYRAACLNVICISMIWIAGMLLTFIPWTQPHGQPIAVSLVQGNIPQALKWSPEELQLSLDRYETLTQPLLDKNKLIIWPEAAIPVSLDDALDYINRIDAVAEKKGANILLGIPIQKISTDSYLNALVKLGAGEKQVYSKRRLVPFGEYTPTVPLLSRLMSIMSIPMSNMIPGNLAQKPIVFGDTKILPSICYEIAFPELMLSNDKTIGLLLTITNDAWFGDSSAAAQHIQMAQMRAIEYQRPLLFVSNDGITAIISPEGQIASVAPVHQTFVLNGVVQPRYGVTPWMTNGTEFILAILLFNLLMAYLANRKIHLQIKTISHSTTDTIAEKVK